MTAVNLKDQSNARTPRSEPDHPELSAAIPHPEKLRKLRAVFDRAATVLRPGLDAEDARAELMEALRSLRDRGGELACQWSRQPSALERCALELAALEAGYAPGRTDHLVTARPGRLW